MATRATLSTNITNDGRRKTLAAVRAATKAAASTHAARHLKWHFEKFAIPKYGYEQRSRPYKKLRAKMVAAGVMSGEDIDRPLVFRKELINAVLNRWRVTATGTEGASLILKAPLQSGRFLDIAAVKRMLDSTKRAEADAPRLRRLLVKLLKSGGEMTKQQKNVLKRQAELKAIAKDELAYLIKIEEQFFSDVLNKPERMRTL